MRVEDVDEGLVFEVLHRLPMSKPATASDVRAALAAVIPLVQAAEREACAVVGDKGEADYRPCVNNPGLSVEYWRGKADAYRDCAAAIRARNPA